MDYDFVGNRDKLLTKQNIIAFLFLLIIVLAIPVGVRMAQTQQQFQSQASGDEITFPNLKDLDANGTPISKSPVIKVQLNSPFGPAPSELRSQ